MREGELMPAHRCFLGEREYPSTPLLNGKARNNYLLCESDNHIVGILIGCEAWGLRGGKGRDRVCRVRNCWDFCWRGLMGLIRRVVLRGRLT